MKCIFTFSFWKVGRVIDRAGLEIRYTPFGYRGFESLTFRKKEQPYGCSFFVRDENPMVCNRRSRLPEQESLTFRKKEQPYGCSFFLERWLQKTPL